MDQEHLQQHPHPAGKATLPQQTFAAYIFVHSHFAETPEHDLLAEDRNTIMKVRDCSHVLEKTASSFTNKERIIILQSLTQFKQLSRISQQWVTPKRKLGDVPMLPVVVIHD